MTRNLKVLGAVLGAFLAMSAMTATGAQAEKAAHFELGTGTVKLDTSADGSQTYTLGGRTFICTTLDGSAAVSGTEASEVTSNTDINYTNCHTTVLGISFPTTWVQEANCHYLYTVGTYTAASNDAHGSVHICGTTINIYTSAATHTAGTIRCQMHIPAQTVSGLTFTNTTTESKMAITVDVNASVTSTVTKNGSTIGCSSHEHGSATYVGNMWFKGTDVNEEYTDVTIQEPPPPPHITTAADGNQTYSLSGRTVVCTQVAATAPLPEESTEVTAEELSYSGCHTTVLGISFPTTVATNGCHLTFEEGPEVEEGTKTEGSMGLSCPGEVKSMTINFYTSAASHAAGTIRCQIHIPEQTFSGTVTYHNTTREGAMAVTVTGESLGVTSTVTQNGSTIGCSKHEHGTASLSGSLWWQGETSEGEYVDLTVPTV